MGLWACGFTSERLSCVPALSLHGVQVTNMGSCPAAQECGDLRAGRLQPLPRENRPLGTWGWLHGRKKKPLLYSQRSLAGL